MRTRVKICGITRPEDALAAVSQGADAIGLVFYPPSPRAVDSSLAARIAAVVPPFVSLVGLFVDASRESVAAVLDRVPLDQLQFHGNESPEACKGHGRRYIKALRMRAGIDLARERARYSTACGLLLDTYRKGIPGGTGEAFQWELIPPDMAGDIILAGGLNPNNVQQAIGRVRPHAVDVSGGVEASGGIKDASKIEVFMREVKCADQQAN